MFLNRGRGANFGWQWWNIGEVCEEIIGFVEEVDGGVAFAPCGREEDAGLAAGAEGDVGGEARAASGFLQDCRGSGGVAELNPSKADAGWIAGMA